MVSSLRLARRDAGTYHLLSPDGIAGLLRADTIRLGGFADRDAATTAAGIAAATLDRWHAVRAIGASRPGSPSASPESTPIRGIVAGGAATVNVADAESGTYAIEVGVPPASWLATRLQIAQQMYGAIREHGLLEAAAPELEAAS